MIDNRRPMEAGSIGLAIWIGCVGCVALVMGLLTTGTTGATENEPAPKTAPKLCEVQALQDLPYYEGPDADKVRHKLDIYLPRGRTEFPVLVFIHGGSWTHGEKTYFGLNKALAMLCARHGIATVLPNYRLSPAVKHPEHIKDVARAFAWTYKNIRAYGGRPDQLFVGGHSAGGHLAALLATDDAYLKAEGLGLRDIKGVMPMSGVFQIPDNVSSFDRMFGADSTVRRTASPTWLIGHRPEGAPNPEIPPFLILYADHDFPLCGKEPAEKFSQAVQNRKGVAQLLEIRNRNHLTILMNAGQEEDPASKALIDFIQMHGVKK
jgi:acetyl esterase/lipase